MEVLEQPVFPFLKGQATIIIGNQRNKYQQKYLLREFGENFMK
jgi:acetyl-CoA carboxylase alpha subunit